MIRTTFFAATLAMLTSAPTLAADGLEAPPLKTWAQAPETVFAAAEIDLAAWHWIARPVVVFADAPNDPRFIEQLELLEADIADLIERDVVIITDSDPAAFSDLRRQFRPRGFMLVLIGKDGEVELRKPFPWDVRELSRSIDKMPLRQQELRAAR